MKQILNDQTYLIPNYLNSVLDLIEQIQNLCEMGDLHNAAKEEDMTLRNNNTIED